MIQVTIPACSSVTWNKFRPDTCNGYKVNSNVIYYFCANTHDKIEILIVDGVAVTVPFRRLFGDEKCGLGIGLVSQGMLILIATL